MTRTSGGTSRPARSSRRGGAPLISAIVASAGTREQLAECLSSLLPQCSRVSAQVVVARTMPPSETAELRALWPTVRFVAARGDARALRASAMAASDGDIVAFTTDARVPPPDWIATLLARSSS